MRFSSLFAAVILTLWMCLACAGLDDVQLTPTLPPSPAYVGVWRGPGMVVSIEESGNVSVKTTGAGNNTEITAPAMSWDAGELAVGIGPFVTTYTIDEAPFEVDGTWRMVMEGVPLERDATEMEPLDKHGKQLDIAEEIPIEAPVEEDAPTP